jgi:TolA-binding protein
MSFADLHPEALLEKEARGTLDDRDRAHLELHLERCEACRFEQRVRKDFAEELAGSEFSPETGRLAELLTSPEVPPPNVAGLSLRARLGASATWLIAAAIVCATGGAIGVGVASHVFWRFEEAHISKTHVARTPEAAQSPAPPLTQEVHADVPATALIPSEERQLPPDAPAIMPATPPSPMPKSTAVSLFDAESNARRQGDYVQALSIHRQLGARFGLSMEAQVSRAVMGRGLLDRGRADDALACFDDYLAFGSGDLGEEVMAGRATALERLDRTNDARAAWQRLVETYPRTTYASRATARLESSSAL